MSSDIAGSRTGEPTFARDLGLFDATMIGVGAMIGAGIFVLTGIAAGESGPASILAFALNGFVTLLTAFAYAELAAAIPEAGGGYAFVRRAFPGVVGFTAGWMLWFAYTVACSLYALGFAGYFWEFFLKYLPGLPEVVFSVVGEHGAGLVVTVVIATTFVQLNAKGTEVTGMAENVLTVAKLIILGVFVAYGLKAVGVAPPEQTAQAFNPFFPQGFGGVIVAMGLTFIAFEGYDLIATVAEEIKEPEKNIPRATFISLGITVVMYLLILFVALAAVRPPGGQPSWQFLGEYGETAIVRAAEGFMPAFGVAVIVFGGLLSTMSALNATILASSRVAFSMGRDRWLPDAMAKIHPERRTPHIAIMVTGAILLAMALTLPIEAVGSAASLIFLLTFALVNLSLIVLRRKAPHLKRRYRVPFYPVVPILGLVLNVFLALYQFSFQPLAWYVTIGWVMVGLILYYGYFEKRAAVTQPQVLEQPAAAIELLRGTVVVPLHNPDHVGTLLDYARPIAEIRDKSLLAYSVVEVPRQLPIHEGLRFAHHREGLLKSAQEIAAQRGFDVGTDLVIAHRAADGIVAGARRFGADFLFMGWKGHTNTRDRIFGEVADQVIRQAPCDVALLKIASTERPKRCLFPTAGGTHARLAAQVLNALAPAFGMEVTTCYIVPPGATEQARREADTWITKTLEEIEVTVPVERKLIEAKSIAGGIALESRDYDLVVLGAAREPFWSQVVFGEIPEKVARYSPASVLVVKRYEGHVRSLLKRALG
ncbi:MAG: amino acid permease [Gemmatimonadota bacterium]|nr:amino acid permease [Gemmatimonadota bacterium]